jgi:uncharacterized protein (UPF0218 family)
MWIQVYTQNIYINNYDYKYVENSTYKLVRIEIDIEGHQIYVFSYTTPANVTNYFYTDLEKNNFLKPIIHDYYNNISNTLDKSYKLIDINTDTSTITNEMIKSINYDYQAFLVNRETILNGFKDNYKKTLDIFNHLKLPSIEKYLSSHFADMKKNKLLCSHCQIYETDNRRSLARHTNTCKKTKHIEIPPGEITESIESIDSNESIESTNIITKKTKRTNKLII